MKEAVLLLINGAGVGAIYAMIAMSLNVIYGATSILNFAQGYWVVVAALLASLWVPAARNASVGWWLLGMVVITAAVAALMALQGWLTLLPLRSSTEQHSWLVTTLAASVIIGGIILLVQGPEAILVGTHVGEFELGGVRTTYIYLLAMAAAVGVYALLRRISHASVTGLAMQALRQDLDASQAAGIPVRRLQLLAFALSGAIIGFVGFTFGPVLAPADARGVELVLNGFTAAVIGGLGNMKGALIAGPAVGVATVATGIWVGSDFQRTVVLAILIVILLGRPQGLFGRVAARRV